MGRVGPTNSCFLNIMASVFEGWIVSLFKELELDIGEKRNGTENTISQNLLIKILWYLAEFLLLSYLK